MKTSQNALLLAALTSAACAAPKEEALEFRLEFRAVDDRGDAVAKVGVSLRQGAATTAYEGATGGDGSLLAVVRALDGDILSVAAECPEGYHEAEHPETLPLRRVSRENEGAASTLQLTVLCPRAHRLAALVIRAGDREGLPVLVDGTVRALTDASGAAHVSLSVPPHSQVRVTLDTEGEPSLRPRSPERVFQIDDIDPILVLDQDFEELRKKPRRVRRAAPPPPPPPPVKKRPIRID